MQKEQSNNQYFCDIHNRTTVLGKFYSNLDQILSILYINSYKLTKLCHIQCDKTLITEIEIYTKKFTYW